MKGTYSSNPTPQKSRKGCFAGWSRREVFLFFSCLGMLTYLVYVHLKTNDEEALRNCADSSCYAAISEIEDFVDTAANPCEDFHQFACGSFLKTAYRKQISDVLTEERRELENELSEMIVAPISPGDSQAVRLQKTFYRVCAGLGETDAERNRPLASIIEQLGSWPLLDEYKWDENKFNWTEVLLKCGKLGLPFQWFLEFGLHWDERNYFKVSYPTIDPLEDATKTMDYMEEVFDSLLGKTVKVRDICNFGQQLIKLTENQNSQVIITTIAELQRTFPVLDWLNFLNNFTEGTYMFTEDSEIASGVGEYFEKLVLLLGATDQRVQGNYIIWKILEYFSPYVSERLRRHTDNTSRSKFCIEQTKNLFPYVTPIEYIRKYSSKKLKESVENLASEVKSEFLRRIEESTWLNTTAGQTYLAKFNETIIEVGGREELFDDQFVDLNYLHIGNLTYEWEDPNIIDVICERSKSYYNSIFSTINETGIDPKERTVVVRMVRMDPNFHSYLNKLILPLPLLHGFLYDTNRPSYLNFGSLGTTIAKGFISAIQNLTKDDVNTTNVAFEASNKCFEDDYLRLTSEEAKVIPDETQVVAKILPEIIGRDIAYKAYEKWVEMHGEEGKLSWLPHYTPNQLFWIKSSLINCYKELPDVGDEFDLVASKYKNILAARHSPRFGRVFDCPDASLMNPLEKC